MAKNRPGRRGNRGGRGGSRGGRPGNRGRQQGYVIGLDDPYRSSAAELELSEEMKRANAGQEDAARGGREDKAESTTQSEEISERSLTLNDLEDLLVGLDNIVKAHEAADDCSDDEQTDSDDDEDVLDPRSTDDKWPHHVSNPPSPVLTPSQKYHRRQIHLRTATCNHYFVDNPDFYLARDNEYRCYIDNWGPEQLQALDRDEFRVQYQLHIFRPEILHPSAAALPLGHPRYPGVPHRIVPPHGHEPHHPHHNHHNHEHDDDDLVRPLAPGPHLLPTILLFITLLPFLYIIATVLPRAIHSYSVHMTYRLLPDHIFWWCWSRFGKLWDLACVGFWMGWWGFVVSTFGLLWWRTVVVVLRVIGILEEDEARVEIPRARARARARRRVAAWDDGERADLVAGGMEAEVEENEEEREEE